MKTNPLLKLMTLVAMLVTIVSCSESSLSEAEPTDFDTPLTKSALTEIQTENLVFVFEEEKMARDVYYYLNEKWNLTVFANIIDSEQNHKDAMEKLLISYEIDYPDNDTYGEFSIDEIRQLYIALTTSGESSILAALEVGMTIEDFDIEDLQARSEEFEDADVVKVLGNLTEGSMNHLRAFYSNLKNLDETYTYSPQFISQELFDAIIASTDSRGHYGSK
ncbi:DUF2202 domain-containing protein [Mangrovibacterium diazotrophicum]|uniref:DUF2202 domain-containing protein n=1 Tax=Mangrovibacterium diazotrophicum TaxID=1261403 RepID=A0A419VVH8_9BACT|nr:DUF2202 domain-containing protein [Mangrovibacterium diazotrophicum]RKD86135.1 hypothetical protein BC643_4452 [Mangrovibacterium diazotrophicum]